MESFCNLIKIRLWKFEEDCLKTVGGKLTKQTLCFDEYDSNIERSTILTFSFLYHNILTCLGKYIYWQNRKPYTTSWTALPLSNKNRVISTNFDKAKVVE